MSKESSIQELFLASLEISEAKRESWLREESGAEEWMVREVIQLLQQDRVANDPLEAGLAQAAPSAVAFLENQAKSGLHVRCPHCHHPIELVDAELSDVVCDSCGSNFSLLTTDETKTYGSDKPSRIAHFELVEKVGVGAFGSVFKARDEKLDRIVALKIPRKGQLTGEESEKFLREARTAAQLRHPNIVAVHEVGRENDRIFIVSDFVEGVTLSDWLTGATPSPNEAAALCVSIVDALQYAHEQGVIHRDLKPGNIMLDRNNQPHLMDFGLAKREAGEITMTVEGQILGTPAYMSPEQARGDAHAVDGTTDIYAIGVILFEMLTGERPFRGNSRMLLHQVLTEDAPSPRKLNGTIPKDLETICLKCLEKQPGNRYPTGKSLAADLQRFLDHEPITARPVSSVERAWRWCKRKPAISSLALLLVIVLVLGSVISTYFAIDAQRNAADLSTALDSEKELVQQKSELLSEKEKLVADLSESVKNERRAREEAEESEQRAKNVLESVVEMFDRASPIYDGTSTMTVIELLDIAADIIENSATNDPKSKVMLLTAIGSSFAGVGDLKKSIELLGTALQQHLKIKPLDQRQGIDIRFELAASQAYAGESEKALENLRIAQKEAVEFLGKEHPKTATIQVGIGVELEKQGDFDEAVKQMTQAMGPLKSAGDTYVTHYASAKNTLAMIHYRRKEYSQALELFKDAAELLRSARGDNHPRTITTMGNLAQCYGAMGEHKKQEELLKQLVESSVEKSGARNLETLVLLNNLAGTYFRDEKYEKAANYYQMIVDETKTRWPRHRSHIFAIHNLANCKAKLGQVAEAIDLASKNLQVAKEIYGEADYRTITMAYQLAMHYEKGYQVHVAINLWKQLVDWNKRAEGGDATGALSDLASCYRKFLRLDEAIEAYQSLVALRIKELGEKDKKTQTAMAWLGVLYAQDGKLAEASEQFSKLFSIRKKILGEGHRETLVALDWLQLSYVRNRNWDQAGPLIEEWNTTLSNEEKTNAYALSQLAEYSLHKKEFTKATEIAKQVLEIPKVKARHRAAAKSILGLCLTESGQLDEAEKSLIASCVESSKALNSYNVIYRFSVDVYHQRLVDWYLSQKRPEDAKKWEAKRKEVQVEIEELRTPIRLVMNYWNNEQFDIATQLFEQKYQLRKDRLGAEHRMTQEALFLLAAAYSKVDRIPESIGLIRTYLDIFEPQFGIEDRRILEAKRILAEILTRADELDEARELLADGIRRIEGTVENVEELNSPQDKNYLNYLTSLTAVYESKEDLVSAEKIHDKAFQFAKKQWGVSHQNTRELFPNYFECLCEMHKFDKARQVAEYWIDATAQLKTKDPRSWLDARIANLQASLELGETGSAFKFLNELKAEKDLSSAQKIQLEIAEGLLHLRNKEWNEAEPLLVNNYKTLEEDKNHDDLPDWIVGHLETQILQMYREWEKPGEFKIWEAKFKNSK